MSEKKEPEPQEVIIYWGDKARDRKKRDGLIYSGLLQVAWQISQYCLISGKKPNEVVPTFANTFELLQDWFRGGMLRDQIQEALETVGPDKIDEQS